MDPYPIQLDWKKVVFALALAGGLNACQGAPQVLTDLATLPKEEVIEESNVPEASPLMGEIRSDKEIEGNLTYARQQFFLKHYDVAEYYFKKTLLYAPDHSQALNLLPWSQFFQKRFDRALISFSNAHAHSRRSAGPLTGMAWCYFAMGFYDQALDTFKRAARYDPDSFQITKGLGWTYLLLKRTREAGIEFEKIYSERERLDLYTLWDHWKAMPEPRKVPVVAVSSEEEALFTLSMEGPRYPSLLFVWNQRPHSMELEKAWRLYRKGSFKRALDTFLSVSGEAEDTLDTLNGQAWSHLQTGNLMEAEQLFEKILQRYPEFKGALEGIHGVQVALQGKARVANHYLEVKKYRIAEDHFQTLIDEFPKWSHPPARLGIIALEEGREPDAVQWFDTALELNPSDPDALDGMRRLESEYVGILFQAEKLRRDGDPKAASYLYWDYIQSRGDPVEVDRYLARAYNGLAWTQYEKGLYELAYDNFDRVQNFEMFRYDVTKGKGLSLYQLGEYEEAADWLTSAETMQDNDTVVSEALDWSILKARQLNQAEQYFLNRLQRRPLQASAYMALGWVYYLGANPDLGVEYFLKSISLKPELALNAEFIDMLKQERFGWQVYTRLGWEYYHRHEYDISRRLFQAALLREPESSEALKGSGYAYYRLQKLEQAEDFLRRSLAANRHPVQVEEVLTGEDTSSPVTVQTSPRTVLGRILLQQDRPEDALEVFLEAREAHPDWPDVNDGLGWAYLKLDRLTESRAAFNKAIQYQPLHPKAHQGLREVKRLLATKHL